MSMTSAVGPPCDRPTQLLAEQFFVTHCARGDGLQDQEGFGARAASCADPELLRFVQALPAHEAPVELWPLRPLSQQVPRRLALLRLPDQRVALVHSSYLPEDTRGRTG